VHHPRGALGAELQQELDALAAVLVEAPEDGLAGRLVGLSQHVRPLVGVQPADERPQLLVVHVRDERLPDSVWQLEEDLALFRPRQGGELDRRFPRRGECLLQF